MYKKMVEWLKDTRSTLFGLTWEARFWGLVGLGGVFYPKLASSISIVFFMSAWANAKAARIERKEVEKECEDE